LPCFQANKKLTILGILASRQENYSKNKIKKSSKSKIYKFMKLLNLLAPKFLKNLDDYFLLHHRLLWLTKVHYVLYYGLVTALAGATLIWAYPLRTDSSLPETALILFLSILLGLPALIFWLHKQTLYSIEKNYGNLFPFMEQLRFGIYLFCFAIFAGIPIYFAVLVENKVANLENREQLAKDIYSLNAGNPYFPSNQNGENGDVIWEEDKAKLQNWDGQQQFPQLGEGRNYYNFMPFHANYYYKYDSYPPDHIVFKTLFLTTDTDAKRLELIENFIIAHNKYSSKKIEMMPQEVLAAYKAHQISYTFSGTYEAYKYEINNTTSLIARTQGNPLIREKDLGTVLACIVFGLGIFLSVFQNVKWQDFVVGAIGFLASSLVFSISMSFVSVAIGGGGEILVFSSIVLAFMFFLFKSYQINHLQVFSRLRLFALMFANALSPFIILLVMALVKNIFDSPFYFSHQTFEFGLATGASIYVVIFMPFFRKMYLKMRALPRS
jgi:hypothetical protein